MVHRLLERPYSCCTNRLQQSSLFFDFVRLRTHAAGHCSGRDTYNIIIMAQCLNARFSSDEIHGPAAFCGPNTVGVITIAGKTRIILKLQCAPIKRAFAYL